MSMTWLKTANHFRCIDMVIDDANQRAFSGHDKASHEILKSGTSDSRQDWFAVGEYKSRQTRSAGRETVAPEDVESRMRALLNASYANTRKIASRSSDSMFSLNPSILFRMETAASAG